MDVMSIPLLFTGQGELTWRVKIEYPIMNKELSTPKERVNNPSKF